MMNLKNSVSVASICAALSLAAPAQAAIVSYDATISYTLDFSAGSGDLLFRLSYDNEAADQSSSPSQGVFPILSFEIRDLTGALNFGSTSSAAGDTGRIVQFSDFFDFNFQTAGSESTARIGGAIAIANPNVPIDIDLNDLDFGQAYGSFIGSDDIFITVPWTPTQIVTNVPLPSSFVLMSLVAGGAAMRAAAKSRRAAKRAGAGSRKAQA